MRRLEPGSPSWHHAVGENRAPSAAALVDGSPVAIISTDCLGAVTAWNPAAAQLLGWVSDDVLGAQLTSVLQAEDECSLPLAEVFRGRALNGAETCLRTRSGELVDVAVWTAPVLAPDGAVDGYQLVLIDIAERKRWERERSHQLQEKAERAETQRVLHQFEFLADATGELSTSLDLQMTLARAASVAVPELADWCTLHLLAPGGATVTAARAAADPSLEATLAELQRSYPPTPDGMSPASQALRTGRSLLQREVSHDWLASTALDARHLDLLERLAPVSVMGIPLIARDRTIGAMTFASVTPGRYYDATTMALAEALARRCALAIDNAQLHAETRDALRARDTFLSVASHELGGPLARLKLHTEVLLMAQSRHSLDEALLERSLGSIQRATNRLAAITQDLLDVARWQRGALALRPVRLNFAMLIREVVRGFKQRLTDEDHLELHVARGRHIVVGDAVRLQQVCENILDNAFKYSPDGGDVRIDLWSEGGGVLLRVADHGIGLPPGSTELIFEPFGRAANAERRSLPGMGLGLYICRSTVERHGGRIWAESAGELQGTSINVWLPGPAQ
jgi:PAS domain S-box-containing protein